MAKVVEIILPNDDPSGVRIIKLANFTGVFFVIPRANLATIENRSEINSPAIYYLFGEGKTESKNLAYIGESERFYQRLMNHDLNKEFWNIAIVCSGDLDRACVKYLENQSVILAKMVDRYEIVNTAKPPENRLSETKKIIVDDYFQKIKFIMTLLGLPLFQDIPTKKDSSEIYYLEDQKNKDAKGLGTLLPNHEFIVFKDSLARFKETPGFIKSLNNTHLLREHLETEGVFKRSQNGNSFIFTKDYIFSSPSKASDIILARPSNGWIAWRDKSGKTLDENKRN